jgi:hypothetical protein
MRIDRPDESLYRLHLISPEFKEGLLSASEINAVADVEAGVKYPPRPSISRRRRRALATR